MLSMMKKFKKALTQGGRPERSIFQDYEERQKEMEIEIKTLKLAIAGLENRIKKNRAGRTDVCTDGAKELRSGINEIRTKAMRIYMDVCCFNRPYDDETQDRIRFEAEAVMGLRGAYSVRGGGVDTAQKKKLSYIEKKYSSNRRAVDAVLPGKYSKI